MKENEIQQLLNRYQAGETSQEENELLFSLIDQLGKENFPAWDEKRSADFIHNLDKKMAEATGMAVFRNPGSRAAGRTKTIAKWLAAASVLLLITLGGYMLYINGGRNKDGLVTKVSTDVAPGKNGALLLLDNGDTLVLDGLPDGTIARQAGVEVKLSDGGLYYDTKAKQEDIVYNVLQTPKGRQFNITLPDGTRAWMNASSSLRYPTVFVGKTRTVQVSGEVYFEVAKNAARPFIAEINEQTKVQVLGTHFNINAYPNENSIRTTLLEGKVKVLHNNHSAVIRPGQQAKTTDAFGLDVVEADTEEAIAWKTGYFQFNDADLPAVLRQLVRWYDVEVQYKGAVPHSTFVGQISRNTTLSQVLRVLSNSGVKFSIENKTIIIQP